HHRAWPLVEELRVDAIPLLVDLVRQAPLAPALHIEHLAAQITDPLRHALDLLAHPGFVQTGLEDEGGLVFRHDVGSSLRIRRLNRFMAAVSPSSNQQVTAAAASCSISSA